MIYLQSNLVLPEIARQDVTSAVFIEKVSVYVMTPCKSKMKISVTTK
jgi:hypothetical protein